MTDKATNTPVSFTVFESTGYQSKVYSLDSQGKITKQASPQMTTGKAKIVNCDFAQFPAILDSQTAKQASCYGTHDVGMYGESAKIAVASKANPPSVVSRTQTYFDYRPQPGVIMVDHDPVPNTPAQTPQGLVGILGGLVPGFSEAAKLIRGSVSSGVVKKGEKTSNTGGYHVYLPVLDASDIPRFGLVLFKLLWLAGFGRIALAANGAMLVRTLIDGAVFSGERLDFTGHAIIASDGLTYIKPASEYLEGGYLDTRQLADLTPEQEADYQALVQAAKAAMAGEATAQREKWIAEHVQELVGAGVPVEQARVQLETMAGCHDLPANFTLHFSTLGSVTVGEVLAKPLRYDGKSLADPIEGMGYGRTTAIFYANIGQGKGKAVIHSQAHGSGTRYFLKNEPVNKVTQDVDKQNQDVNKVTQKVNTPTPPADSDTLQSEVERLAMLSKRDYYLIRNETAKRLGIGRGQLDALRQDAMRELRVKNFTPIEALLKHNLLGDVILHHFNASVLAQNLLPGVIGFDEFRQKVVTRRAVPWRRKPGNWEDADTFEGPALSTKNTPLFVLMRFGMLCKPQPIAIALILPKKDLEH